MRASESDTWLAKMASILNTVLKQNELPIKENCINSETRFQNVVLKTKNMIKQTKGKKNPGSYEKECDISCFLKIKSFKRRVEIRRKTRHAKSGLQISIKPWKHKQNWIKH